MSKIKAKGIVALLAFAIAVILAAALSMSLPVMKASAADNPLESLPTVDVTDDGVATVNDWKEMVVAINYDGSTSNPLNPGGKMVNTIILGTDVTFDFLNDAKLQVLMAYFAADTGGYDDCLYISRSIVIDLGSNTLAVHTDSEEFAVILYGDSDVTIRNGSVIGSSKGDFVDAGSGDKGAADLTLQDVNVNFTYNGTDPTGDAVIFNAGNLSIENVTFDVTGGVRNIANATLPEGTVSYATLQDEINDLSVGYVSTVTLGKNYTESITIPEGISLTLDLAGHTLTNTDGKHTITNYGSVTIVDTVGGGVVDNVSNACGALVNYGTAQIGTGSTSGGTFTRSQETGAYDALNNATDAQGGNSWYTIKNYGHLSVYNDATLITTNKTNRTLSNGRTEPTGGYSSLVDNGYFDENDYNTNSSKVTAADGTTKMAVYGGKFVGGMNTVKNDPYGYLDVQGGQFENYVQNVVLNYDTAEISGGEFTLTGAVTEASAVVIYTAEKITISGGTFKAADVEFPCKTFAVASMYEGTAAFTGNFTVEGVDYGVVVTADSSITVAEGVTVPGLNAAAQIVRNGQTLVYGNLSDAVVAAQDNEVVELVGNVVLAEVLSIENKSVTLDLAEYKITLSGDFGGKDVAIRVGDNGALTIEGNGKIDASNNETVPDNIVPVGAMGNGSKVIINGGTIVVDTAYESCVFANTDGYVEINGGSLQNLCEDEYKNGNGGPALTVNVRAGVEDAGKLLVVNGGTYIGRNPALGDDSVSGTFLGADVKIARTEDGSFAAFTGETPAGATAIYYDEDEGSVAEVYTAEALSEALKDGYAVVRLGADIEASVTIPEGMVITLDLAGKTLTNEAGKDTITNNGTLTVIDTVGGGVVDNESNARAALVNYGTATLNGGTYTRSKEDGIRGVSNSNTYYVIRNLQRGTMEIGSGVTVYFGASADDAMKYNYSSLVQNCGTSESVVANMTISGGSFYSGGIVIKNDDYGVMNISGGTYVTNDQAVQNWWRASVSDGTFQGKLSNWEWNGATRPADWADKAFVVTGGTVKGEVFAREYIGENIYVELHEGYAISGGTFTTAVDYRLFEDGKIAVWDEESAAYVVEDGQSVAVIDKDGVEVGYSSLQAAIDAAASGETVTLLHDLELTGTVTVPYKKVTLDLGGNTVTANWDEPETESVPAFKINTRTTVTFRNGTIHAKGTAIEINGSNLMASGQTTLAEDLIVESENSAIFAKAGMKLVSYAKIYSRLAAIMTNGAVSGYSTITIEAGEVISTNSVAMYLPARNGQTTINGGLIQGTSGIEVRGGARSLIINDGATIIATGTELKTEANGSGNTVLSGAALAISKYANTSAMKVTVNGGSLQGLYAVYEANLNPNGAQIDVEKITVNLAGGSYQGKISSENLAGFISGGTFSEALDAEYLAADCVQVAGETFVVGKTEEVIAKQDVVAVIEETATAYTSLQAAIDAAASGDTVKLLQNIAVSQGIFVQKDLVIDLNGNSVASTSQYGFTLLGDYDLTIQNGKIGVNSNEMYAFGVNNTFTNGSLNLKNVDISVSALNSQYAFAVYSKGSVAVENGAFTVENGKDGLLTAGVVVQAGTLQVSGVTIGTPDSKVDAGIVVGTSNEGSSTAIIEGVSICANSVALQIEANSSAEVVDGMYVAPYAIYAYGEGADANVSDGTFEGLVQAVEGAAASISGGEFTELVPETYLAEGFALTVSQDGTYGVAETVAEATLVRGDAEYRFASFAEAVSAAASGDTVVLEDNVTLDESLIIDQAIVLDLGGFTLTTENNAIVISADATVMSGTIDAAAGEAGYVDNGTTAIAVQGAAVKLVEGLKVTGEASNPSLNLFLITVENGSLEVADSDITMTFTSDSGKQGQVIRTVNSDLAISGSTIVADGGYGVAFRGGMTQKEAVAADASEYNKLTVADSTVTATYFAIAGNGTTHGTDITVSGNGKIESSEGAAIYHPQYGILRIALNEDSAQAYIRGLSGIEMRAGVLNAESGSVEATGSALVAEPNGNGSTTEGAAVAVVQHTTKLPISVELSGGTYKGQYALYEENQQQNGPEAIKEISISVTGGVYEGSIGSQNITGFITGGKFAQLPNEDCMSPDYVAQLGSDGYYVPVEYTVLRAVQKNAQADIREYAAMLGMRWTDIEAATESDEDAALVISLYDSIVEATSENRVAKARLAAMDAIDKLIKAVDDYKAELIAQLQAFALNDPATDEDDLDVVVPTATYLSINSAATKAEAEFYYNNAIAEVRDIRAYRAEIEAQTATLETLAAALSDLGEETLLSNIQQAIAKAQNAITGGDSYTLAGISDYLTNTINSTLQTLNGKFDTYAEYMTDMYEAILGTGEGTSLFEQIEKAIADAQEAITSGNAQEIADAVEAINDSIAAAAADIKGAIPDYAAKLDTISGTLESLQTAVGGNNTAIAGVLQAVKDAQAEILGAASATDADIAEVMEAVTAANAAVADAKNSILDAIGGTDGLASKLTAITNTLAGFETELGSITTSIGAELDLIDSAISGAQTNIDSILTKLDSLATGSDITDITEDLAAILEDIAGVQTSVDEISVEVSTVTAVADAQEQAFTDIEAWLNEYLDSIIGGTEEADSGAVVVLAFTAETTDGDIYAKLTQAFSESNAKLVLKYYNEALASIDSAKTVSDVTTAVSTFKAQVASVEAAAQNTSNLTGVYVLLVIVFVAVLVVLVIVLLKKKHGVTTDDDSAQAEEVAAEPAPKAETPAEAEAVKAEEEPEDELAAELDDDKEQVVIAANVRSFAEAYVDMSDELQGLFNKVKDYALSKEGTTEAKQSSGVCIKRGGKQVVKLTVRRGYPVALFVLENEMLKDFRRTTNTTAKLKVRATELVLREDADLAAAYTMVDLSIEQIDKDIEAAKERRREARRARRKQKQEEAQEIAADDAEN